MNFIHSLYIHQSKKVLVDTFGWRRAEYHLMSWALSCLQMRNIYGNITLCANSEGAKLLIDTLKLPYAEVNTSLDNLKLPDINLWALPKLYTYSLQEDSFLHIDGDVFLFDKLPEKLLQADLIAQNMEIATEYYTSTQRELMEHFSFFPACVKNDFASGIPINAVNAGILGGNDTEFIRRYTCAAFEYINRNIHNLKNINVDRFNVFFEQHLFYSMAVEERKSVNYLFDNLIEDKGYLYLGNFHEVPFKRTYLHLIGHLKRDEITCIQMAAKLRELYPDYYYRIISIFQKHNIPIFTSFYKNRDIGINEDYSKLSETCINTYKNYQSSSNDTHLSSMMDILKPIFFTYIINESMKNDFETFSESLSSSLKKCTTFSDSYFYGRDLSAVKWFRQIFENNSDYLKTKVIRTNGAYIIESRYDWSGLFNKHYRRGIPYYEELNIEEGLFSNLIIYELFGSGFMMYDIDDIEKMIFDLLADPLSIEEIIHSLKFYFDDDVIEKHFNEYQNLIIESIKYLILYKAIQPAN